MFLKLLENWDPELKTDEEPVAFAMFGRGRALGPIVGEEINPEWIGDVCVYLTGACSCQIKRDNPGWDILLMVDWEGVIRGQYTLAEALPKLTTPAAVAEQTALVVSNGEVKPVKATLPKTDISSTSAAEPTDSETSPGPQEQPTAQPTATPQATTTAAEDGNSFLLPVAIALGGAIVLVVTLSLIVRQVRRGDL